MSFTCFIKNSTMEASRFYKLFTKLKRIELASRRTIINRSLFVYGDEVARGRQNKRPLVALESTIITHGMPFPENLNTAIRVENIIRENNAIPATIAILNGKIHVGLNHEQLEILSKADPVNTLKCSRRDMSFIVSKKLNAGTTVSATMLIANLAGIFIMATGGIGGVHRGGELTFDVSTDLMELGRTPVAVVCSGVKSILDIPKTLEYLETHGVPVVKIGSTDYFPAFYCTETHDKVKAPYRIPNSQEAAELLMTQKKLGMETGILFAVPIPEKYALDPKQMEVAICEAIATAKSKSIIGKNVTPFLLEELNKITHSQSLQANIALIENNAKIAAEIATNCVDQQFDASSTGRAIECVLRTEKSPVVVGGAIMDTTLQVFKADLKVDGGTHAGRSHESCGGVGRNVANALIILGLDGTRLISVVGNDQPGKSIIKSLGDGAQTVEQLPKTNTARCTVIINGKGDHCFGIGEMGVFASITPDLVRKHQSRLEAASIIVLDGNLPLNTFRYVMDIASLSKIPVWYEPTDVTQAAKIFKSDASWQNVLHFISPNEDELLAIASHFGIPIPEPADVCNLEDVEAIAKKLAEYIPVVISTLASKGAMIVRKASENDPFYGEDGQLIINSPIKSRLYTPVSHVSRDPEKVVNVSGGGDCLTAGILYGIHKNFNETDCMTLALKAAALSLASLHAVPSSLSSLRKDAEF